MRTQLRRTSPFDSTRVVNMSDYSHLQIAAKDFSKKTLNQLSSKGIRLADVSWAPGTDGSFSNGERVYALVIDGCQYMRTYLQVLVCASSSWRGES